MNFAEKLSNLRIQNGYSQEGLAEKLYVSRQAVSKWEVGATLPETDKLIAISNFFHVSIDYLLKDNVKVNYDESLERLVIKFLKAAWEMDEISQKLVCIMKDGAIDQGKKEQISGIAETLEEILVIIEEVKQRMSKQ
ncbi:MAG: helix-turn-helix transcriptional regulator [Lachnospiraceae bacterium]|nr:helix-turn-helix transcriptional regulator [Lachnospiraceae bacterium]